MNALITAEVLRLRTLRMPVVIVLGVTAIVASNAAPMSGHRASAEDVRAVLRGFMPLGALYAAGAATYSVGDAFQRGMVALTYVAEARRSRVAAAHAVTYAGVGALLGLVASATALAIVLPVAAADHVPTGFSAVRIALTILAAAVTSGVFGGIGALLGHLTRHPSLGLVAAAGWQSAETFITRGGGAPGAAGPYLPSQLTGSATGLSNDVSWYVAIGLLLIYAAGFMAIVSRFALRRDLT
jgi:hypothetical protein